MPRALLPPEVALDSVEAHFVPPTAAVRSIHAGILLLLGGFLAALRLVTVEVAVDAPGVVRPAVEKHELTAGVGGFVAEVLARPAQAVSAGDPLLVLEASHVEERIAALAAALVERERRAADLETLLAAGGHPVGTAMLGSDAVRRDHLRHREEIGAEERRVAEAEREAQRAAALAEAGIVPRAEAEARAGALADARAELTLVEGRQHALWAARLAELRIEIRELRAQRRQAEQDGARHRIFAPVAGTLEEMPSVSAGSFVQAGQRLGVISPSADLVAEFLVSPRDVGLLATGSTVRVLVDAFPHTDWGVLTASVREISADYLPVDAGVAFRVLAALPDTHLTLRNGVTGELRKGMTVRGRFPVAKRTLWQLLRDDVSDWLDPRNRRP